MHPSAFACFGGAFNDAQDATADRPNAGPRNICWRNRTVPQKRPAAVEAAGLTFSETISKDPSGSNRLSLRRSRGLRRSSRLAWGSRRGSFVVMMLLRSAGSRRRGRRARISSLSNNAETKNGRQQEDEFLHINKVGANRDFILYQVYSSGVTGAVNRPSPGNQIQAPPIELRFSFSTVSLRRDGLKDRCRHRKPEFHIKPHLPNPRKEWKFQKIANVFIPCVRKLSLVGEVFPYGRLKSQEHR